MFDIREYYNCSAGSGQGIDYSIPGIDDEIVSDIDTLLVDRVGSLYLCDRYKNNDSIIEIIYPSAGYPGNQTLLMSPDRVRFLLSFYPYKGDFSGISKIVIRPRYFEAGNVELAAIYMRKKQILVLYLTHPYSVADSADENEKFVSVSLENIMDTKVIEDSIDRSGKTGGRIPYLWNILSVISNGGEGELERFFVRMEKLDPKVYSSLNDISYFYQRHGY